MKIGIVGLGLIGGSFAKAYKKAGFSVLGYDAKETVTEFAIICGTLDGELTAENAHQCSLILLATYPGAAIEWLRENAPNISKTTLVIDCCGTKKTVCEACFKIAGEYGFTFIGGHPMAGTHNSGFKHSREDLFIGAPMVMVPPVFDNPQMLSDAEMMLAPAGFGSYSITTAEKHDEMIAFTSQMPHILSNAFIKSPTATLHKGFSAGSYKDLTRVAWLNAPMWTELFMENSTALLNELNTYIENLTAYRDALANCDTEALAKLLEEGSRRKKEVDG